jgi:hypothetical protein
MIHLESMQTYFLKFCQILGFKICWEHLRLCGYISVISRNHGWRDT